MSSSDITFNAEAFDSSKVTAKVAEINATLKEQGKKTPGWWEVGAPRYREMRRNGEGNLPKPLILDGVQAEIPSRDAGRTIPIRIMRPDGDVKIKSVFMYIHGGGWVLMAEDLYDSLIKDIANQTDSLIVSVGYRLAPENPWPAGPEDCYDVADWLVDNAQKEYGASFQFIGGDSAGGNLTILTYIHLAQSRPQHRLSGLVNYYGCYDVSRLPSARNYDGGLVMPIPTMLKFIEAYCPNMNGDDLKNPKISPFYHDFRGHKLPPAIFLCGTDDPLCDDSAMMHVKWAMHGGIARTKFWAGVPHAFMNFPGSTMPPRNEGMKFTTEFVNEFVKTD